MIIVLGSVTVQPDHLAEALRLSHEHVQRSRAEPGCLMHSVSIDGEDPNRLVFFEQWQDMPALQTHFKVPESGGFVRALAKMATVAPSMQTFDAELRTT